MGFLPLLPSLGCWLVQQGCPGPGHHVCYPSSCAPLPLPQDVLSSLSIPHAELDQLASSSLSDAALTAWALTKTASHPALQEAAAASHRLQHLLTKLDGALLWQQQAASSPLGQLLWQVAVGVGGSDVAGLDPEQLEGRIEYQVVAALTR